MIKAIKFILILTLLCIYYTNAAGSISSPYIVNDIKILGGSKTDTNWLESLLETKEGNSFDEDSYELDLQRLRNLNLFFSVQGEWIVLPDNLVNIVIEIKESIYIYPDLGIGGFKDVFKLNAGISTINWRGRGARLGAIYQFYDRHSLAIYQSTPRHSNGKTGHDFTISRYATVEPLYFNDVVADFNYDVYNLMIGGHYWINYKTKIGLGSAYFYEIYKNRTSDIPEFPASLRIIYNKLQLFSKVEWDYRNYNYETVDGYYARLYSEYISDLKQPDYGFYKHEAEFRWYHVFDTFNMVAIRSKLGVATNRITPFLPFVIDGYLNVRGVGNRVHRGTALFVNSIEYRQRLYSHPWFILQWNIFLDISFIRNAEQQLYEMFNSEQNYSYGGTGFRIILQKWYTTTLRVDYSHNLRETSGWGGITFGVGQFF